MPGQPKRVIKTAMIPAKLKGEINAVNKVGDLV
jgi:hypothetical protein